MVLIRPWCESRRRTPAAFRSEEHTSELQSLTNLVCRLLLEKKKLNSDPLSETRSRATPFAATASPRPRTGQLKAASDGSPSRSPRDKRGSTTSKTAYQHAE